MNVKEIVASYLREHGFDGLINDGFSCCCDLKDIFECDVCDAGCVSAKKRMATVDDIGNGDFEVGEEIYIETD